VLKGIQRSEDRGCGGRRPRGGGISFLKHDPLGCELRKERSRILRIAVKRQMVGTQSVNDHQNDIGFGRVLGKQSPKTKYNGDKQHRSDEEKFLLHG